MDAESHCWEHRYSGQRHQAVWRVATGFRLPGSALETVSGCNVVGVCEVEPSSQTRSPSKTTHQSPASLPKEEGPLPNVEDIDTILEPAVGEVSRVRLSLAGQGNILGGVDCTVVGGHHNDRRSCGKYQGRKVSSDHDLPRTLRVLLHTSSWFCPL